MKLSIQAGATSQTVNVWIQDSSSTIGAALTGLAFNTASLTAYYALPKAAAVSITLATLAAITTAWSSGGFKEVDATNMPGWYRLDIPDAALASGRFVSIHLKGAANMAPLPIEIELTAWSNQDAVRGGMTALPNANAEAAGGLYTRGSGAGQIAQQANGQVDVNLSTVKTQAVTCAAGVTVLASVGTAATSTAQTGDGYARLGAPAGASHAADVAAVKVDTAAVKTKTDSLTFTVANQVDSNVIDWKGAAAPAMTGDAFARLGAPVGASISADIAGVQSDTDNLQTRLPASLVSGRMDSSIGAAAADTLTASALAADAVTEIQSGLSTLTAAGVRTAVGLSSANLDTQLSTIAGYIDTEIATLVAGLGALTSGERNAIADAIFARSLGTEGYAADGAVPTFAQFCFMMLSGSFEFSISGTTITAKKLDGSTTAMTFTLDSSTSPTSRTRAT